MLITNYHNKIPNKIEWLKFNQILMFKSEISGFDGIIFRLYALLALVDCRSFEILEQAEINLW